MAHGDAGTSGVDVAATATADDADGAAAPKRTDHSTVPEACTFFHIYTL